MRRLDADSNSLFRALTAVLEWSHSLAAGNSPAFNDALRSQTPGLYLFSTKASLTGPGRTLLGARLIEARESGRYANRRGVTAQVRGGCTG